MKKKVEGIFIEFRNLTENEQVLLLLNLFKFSRKNLPDNKTLIITGMVREVKK